MTNATDRIIRLKTVLDRTGLLGPTIVNEFESKARQTEVGVKPGS